MGPWVEERREEKTLSNQKIAPCYHGFDSFEAQNIPAYSKNTVFLKLSLFFFSIVKCLSLGWFCFYCFVILPTLLEVLACLV